MEPIQILFKEYDTLRAEIITRLNHEYQLLGFGATAATAVAAWLISAPANKFGLIITVVVMFLAVFAYLFWEMRRDIAMLADRLQDLESQINKSADKELLAWESRCSPNVRGRSLLRKKRKQKHA